MATKSIFFALCIAMVASCCLGGLVPAVPAAYSVPIASTYNAHVINHAISTPVAAAPLVAPAPIARVVAPAYAPVATYRHFAAAPVVAY